MANRETVMKARRIAERGTGEAVLQHPRHETTRTLLAAVPRLVVPA